MTVSSLDHPLEVEIVGLAVDAVVVSHQAPSTAISPGISTSTSDFESQTRFKESMDRIRPQ